MDRMSTLPTIKCSSCAVDIDILHLADHVCSAAPPPAPEPMSPTSPVSPISPISPQLTRAATFGGPTFSNRADRTAPSGRMPPPPRIDSKAANKPFRPLEPSPMSNYSDPRSRSPRLAQPPKSPFKMTRSVTTPLTRSMAPPSPDFTSNLDCAFPPFPSKNATPKSAKPRPRERLEPTYQEQYARPSPLFAPLSPRVDGGENVAKRMDSIAPGPFDGKADRRPSTSSASKPFMDDGLALGHRRTATQESATSNRDSQKQRTSVTSNASRASAYSNRSVGLPSRPKIGIGGLGGPPPLQSTSGQSEGIDAFLNRLQKESGARQNEPVRQNSGGKKAPPSRPRRPSERDLPPMGMSDLNPSDTMPRSNTMSSSRNSSRSGSENDVPRGLAPTQSLRPPPLIASALGIDAPVNTLHTPSDSGFSDDSYASSGFRSIASSRSSPPESEAGHSRQASKISRSEYIAEETVERSASPESYAESRPVRAQRSYMRPDGAEPIPRALSPGYARYPESPMDPAIQMGAPRRMLMRGPTPSQDSAELSMDPPPRRMANPEPRQPEMRRPKATSKGNCRGCSEPIVGKSVKDSSGRLTGRYHKQCFVCRTCSDPFPTAEFYVFENSPFCEQHYHKLNGSLCNSCNRGIEGQYLETDLRQKFHPRCFTCSTCRIVLRDGYFEVAGQRYCDRHAQSAAAPPRNYLGPGGFKPRNLQKRGTRLMMMA
ncbi:hypothetical protein BDW02DRAFT_136559 [Decorospora gaudefroyi]|uniref:LIM zinc-binding domain-containing protein n=1 Tax=Decorospora gaudefroyi TaxID=184978 RepID=A0A6A5JZ20_9PLEO|nr:hypothetical protein BDW02DRAFT_136559 [Decorospora gaudefroyi]